MFTQDNTAGYTDAELNALNEELTTRLAAIGPADVDARNEAEKAFADEVARR